MVNLVAVQMTSTPDWQENINFIEQQLVSINKTVPSLVLLPECCACFGTRDGYLLSISETRGDGPIQAALRDMAIRHNVYLITGSIPLKGDDEQHFTASSLLLSPEGETLAEYCKIHMFDVSVNDNTGSYLESKYTQAGDEVVVADTPIGKIGLAVCYDVRFPGLFEAMGDIDILSLPAAFTQRTGKAHWHTLVGARAIEKQCFVVAANQWGEHANGRETFGHSSIYSPWGEILAQKDHGTGMIQANADISQRSQLKKNMPVGQHNRFRSYFV